MFGAFYTNDTHQVLRHLHCNRGDLLAVFTDHLLYDISEIVVFRLPDDVQECVHHRSNVRGDVLFG